MNMKTALIAGATGLVGSELLKLLVESDQYQNIHLMTRRSLGALSPKVTEHITDFNDLSGFQASAGFDHIFCTLGTTIKKAETKENFMKVDYDYVVELAKLAKRNGIKKFLVVSSLGANAKSHIFYNRVKGEVEAALRNLSLPHLFIFRPSLLMGERKEHRSGEKTAIAVYKVISPLFWGPFRKYKGVEAKQVAKAMMMTALENDKSFSIIESDEIQKF
jgi:uncharacterized protein YbjT (DUF2867 family)